MKRSIFQRGITWSMNKFPWVYRTLSDKTYLKLKYKATFGKKLNLKSPATFNEKLQWLKLYDRNPKYSIMVDKYEVKKYVAEIIGEEYVIPTLGVWENFDNIDFNSLPNRFVLKCTHDSGGLIIVHDKENFDKKAARKKINKWLKRNYFWFGREWPYKNVKPRIIAEQYIEDNQAKLNDYKVFNFNGVPKIIEVDYGRFTNHTRNLYGIDWTLIDGRIRYHNNLSAEAEKPKNLEKMLELAKLLSKNIPHVRTDFYLLDDKIYFGEFTFYHGSGFDEFIPYSLGVQFGEWLNLP